MDTTRLLPTAILALAALAGGCSSDSNNSTPITPQEQVGCGESCRWTFACNLPSTQNLATCKDLCPVTIPLSSSECRAAMTVYGSCAANKSCTDLTGGTCKAERTSMNNACGGGGDAGVHDAASDRAIGQGDGGDSDASTGCARFEFVASGQPCGGSCASVTCSCSPFPRSVSSCTPDGCIVQADCQQVCAASSLSAAVSCTDTYTISGGDGGSCVRKTCAGVGAHCGSIDDGCGGTVACTGVCSAPEACGGGGTPNQCGCTPTSCEAQNAECGQIDNLCGTTLTCTPGCTGVNWCGGGGTPNRCGCIPGSGAAGPNGASNWVNSTGIGGEPWDSYPSQGVSNALLKADATQAWDTNNHNVYVVLSGTDVSNWLVANTFNLAIPAVATINGIEVTVRRTTMGQSDTIQDNAARIVKGGSIGVTDRSQSAAWAGAFAQVTYGGPTDLWGTTWTAADVNDPSFGFALSTKYIFGAGNDRSIVDQVQMKVYFTVTCQ